MTRAAFEKNPSSFLVEAMICHHLNKKLGNVPATAKKLRNSIYVDYMMLCAKDDQETEVIRVEAKKFFPKCQNEHQEMHLQQHRINEDI